MPYSPSLPLCLVLCNPIVVTKSEVILMHHFAWRRVEGYVNDPAKGS